MSWLSDLRTISHIVLKPVRGKTHKERLDSFYGGQAADYDRFRQRLLQGRKEMVDRVAATLPESGGVWVELGCGTGSNLELLGERRAGLQRAVLVDLSSKLIGIASERAARLGWSNVELVEADVCAWEGLRNEADAVVFSYALTMIPDWFAAIDTALAALKPGGTLGVVDFYVTRKHESPPRCAHRWWTRAFWRSWFGADNVFVDGDHIHYLDRRCERLWLEERRVRLPYMPIVRCPIYTFLGRKRSSTAVLPDCAPAGSASGEQNVNPAGAGGDGRAGECPAPA
jgi:S-adenosylmethionine-diacylgycerolhomoserine-N-methlytransferase